MNNLDQTTEDQHFKRLLNMPSGLWHKGHDKFTALDKGIFAGLEVISGLVCDSITKVLNHTHIENHDTFTNLYETKNREGKGLLSVSNHTHYIDDPLLIAAMMDYKYLNSLRLIYGDDSEIINFKWTPAAKENIFFNTNIAAWFFGRTKTVPVQRGLGLDQLPWINLQKFLRNGDYIHVFGEATRTREIGKLGGFKPGIGNLISEAPDTIILPWGHDGIQNALPFGCAPEVYKQLDFGGKLSTYFINPRSRIQIVVGEPFSLKEMAHDEPKTPKGYAEIANAIREKVKPCFEQAIELNRTAA